MTIRGSVPLCAALFAVACHGESAEAVRSEAGQMARAVEVLRAAPNEGKRPPLLALEHAPCTAEDVCALQKACVTAYRTQVEALEGVAAVRRAVRNTGEVPPPETTELLSRSVAALGDAEHLAKQCADLESAARRKYSL